MCPVSSLCRSEVSAEDSPRQLCSGRFSERVTSELHLKHKHEVPRKEEERKEKMLGEETESATALRSVEQSRHCCGRSSGGTVSPCLGSWHGCLGVATSSAVVSVYSDWLVSVL